MLVSKNGSTTVATLGTNNDTTDWYVAGSRSNVGGFVTFWLTSAAASMTVTFQASPRDDGSTLIVSVGAVGVDNTTMSTTATAANAYTVRCPDGGQVRAKVTSYTSGSFTVKVGINDG